MNIKIVMLGVSIGVSTLAVECGSTSPKGYAKTSARLNCKTIKEVR